MDRNEIVLAALSPADGGEFSPVQIQKLLFLIEANISDKVGGPHFDFQPYDYGPFDSCVYDVLHDLADMGFVQKFSVSGQNWSLYSLTEGGQMAGQRMLNTIEEKSIRQYIENLSSFVRSLTFPQLVSAIYKAYPEMKVNSVFGG